MRTYVWPMDALYAVSFRESSRIITTVSTKPVSTISSVMSCHTILKNFSLITSNCNKTVASHDKVHDSSPAIATRQWLRMTKCTTRHRQLRVVTQTIEASHDEKKSRHQQLRVVTQTIDASHDKNKSRHRQLRVVKETRDLA